MSRGRSTWQSGTMSCGSRRGTMSCELSLKLGLGSAMPYINNCAVVGKHHLRGMLERFPTLEVVSPESAAL